MQKHQCIRRTLQCSVPFMPRGVIGPYICENAQGQHVTVNGIHYRAILNDYVVLIIIVVENHLEEL